MWAGYIASHLLDDPGVTYKLKEINTVHVRTGLFSFQLPFCFAKDSLRKRVCCGKVISPELTPNGKLHIATSWCNGHVMLRTIGSSWSPSAQPTYHPACCSKIQVVPLDHCHRTGVPPLGGRRCQGLLQLLGNSKWEIEHLGTRLIWKVR